MNLYHGFYSPPRRDLNIKYTPEVERDGDTGIVAPGLLISKPRYSRRFEFGYRYCGRHCGWWRGALWERSLSHCDMWWSGRESRGGRMREGVYGDDAALGCSVLTTTTTTTTTITTITPFLRPLRGITRLYVLPSKVDKKEMNV